MIIQKTVSTVSTVGALCTSAIVFLRTNSPSCLTEMLFLKTRHIDHLLLLPSSKIMDLRIFEFYYDCLNFFKYYFIYDINNIYKKKFQISNNFFGKYARQNVYYMFIFVTHCGSRSMNAQRGRRT